MCEVVYFQLRDDHQCAARGQMVMLQDIGERVARVEEDSIDVQARERIGRMEHSRDFLVISFATHEVLGNVMNRLPGANSTFLNGRTTLAASAVRADRRYAYEELHRSRVCCAASIYSLSPKKARCAIDQMSAARTSFSSTGCPTTSARARDTPIKWSICGWAAAQRRMPFPRCLSNGRNDWGTC